MKTRAQLSGNRSFRWGVVPQFSRGLLVCPPASPGYPRHGSSELRSALQVRRERPSLAAGIAASVLLHGLVIGLWSSVRAPADMGSYATPSLAVSPIQVVRVAAPATPTTPQPAVSEVSERARPVPSFDPPQPTVRRVAAARPAPELVRAEGTGDAPIVLAANVGSGGEGGAEGAVARAGDGQGSGAFLPARARSVLRTWRPPPSVMGLEVVVRVHTDAAGKARGPVELLPATPDGETNQELVYRSRNLEYWPALRDGEPIAAWAEISYTFCYDGVTAASPPSPTFGQPVPCARAAEAKAVVASRTG